MVLCTKKCIEVVMLLSACSHKVTGAHSFLMRTCRLLWQQPLVTGCGHVKTQLRKFWKCGLVNTVGLVNAHTVNLPQELKCQRGHKKGVKTFIFLLLLLKPKWLHPLYGRVWVILQAVQLLKLGKLQLFPAIHKNTWNHPFHTFIDSTSSFPQSSDTHKRTRSLTALL